MKEKMMKTTTTNRDQDRDEVVDKIVIDSK